MRGRYRIDLKITEAGKSNCCISEITVAELKFEAENSRDKSGNRRLVESFASTIKVVPIFTSLDVFAREKARLRTHGHIIDDFDLLIGATAIANDLILVTNNVKHFSRLEGITIENWAHQK